MSNLTRVGIVILCAIVLYWLVVLLARGVAS
jgi:hypothetical protein